jgi:hypothetical protein
MSSKVRSFPLFAKLPGELQAAVWEASYPQSRAHIFDVCVPSPASSPRCRVREAFTGSDGSIPESKHKLYKKYSDTIFLDPISLRGKRNTNSLEKYFNRLSVDSITTVQFSRDPSMYTTATKLAAVCSGASCVIEKEVRTTAEEQKPDAKKNTNVVYLPARDRWVRYSNTEDVLFLRFGRPGAVADVNREALHGDHEDNLLESTPDKGISGALGGIWSAEMANTLQGARRVALDLSELIVDGDAARQMFYQEMVYLACCLQKDLEVLYLVDYSVGRCHCPRGKFSAADLQTRTVTEGWPTGEDGASSEQDGEREPDVIHGEGATWREILDLEKFGMNEDHPAFLVAQILDDSIRSQQRCEGNGPFQGIRILVCEEDPLDGLDAEISVQCHCT